MQMNSILSHGNYLIVCWLCTLFIFEHSRKNYLIPSNIKDGGWNRWLKNILLGLVNRLLGPILMLPMIVWATSIHLWANADWPQSKILLLIDIVILDLASYWFHRFSHQIPFLWRFHEVHHLDSALDATTGLRIHFGEIFFQNTFRIIFIIIFSIRLKNVLIYELILILAGLFHHANIRIPALIEKSLSFMLVTPRRHSVHHHALIQDTDSNYGFIFVWWDKIFKTFNTAARKNTWRIGLEYSPDLSSLKLLCTPFIVKTLKNRMNFDEQNAQ